MADRDVLTRSGVGAALNATQHDRNLNSLNSTVETQTGSTYTVLAVDQNKTIELNNASMNCALTAVATIAAAIDTDSFKVTLKNINAADATIDPDGSEAIDGAATLTLEQYEAVTLQIDAAGTGWSVVMHSRPATTLLDMVYPVGAIFQSRANTSPATTLGGTWTAIQTGRVLLSEDGGTTYTAADTGGSADAVVVSHKHVGGAHSHTVPIAPLHATGTIYAHGTMNASSLTTLTSSSDGAVDTTTVGVSGTNQNLQPYEAVYMWERTA